MQKTDFEYEILIGEDCSTDKTKEIVEKYVNLYPDKIRLITSDHNVGERKNAIRLRENSRGKYIALCDGDDYWIDSYKLQKQVDYMESNPECSLCFHASRIVKENGKPTGKIVRPYNKSGISLAEDLIIGGGGFCSTASLFFPKKLMDNPPDFYLKAHVGDYPIQMWLASQKYAYYIDEIMSAYRTGVKGAWTTQFISGENVTEKFVENNEEDIKLLNEFNKYTNHKYSDAIKKTITKRELDILLLQNKINKLDEIKNTKYETCYNQMGRMDKAKVYSKIYFPKLYSKIVDIARNW